MALSKVAVQLSPACAGALKVQVTAHNIRNIRVLVVIRTISSYIIKRDAKLSKLSILDTSDVIRYDRVIYVFCGLLGLPWCSFTPRLAISVVRALLPRTVTLRMESVRNAEGYER